MASSGGPHTGSSKPVCIVQKRGFILSFVEHSHRTRLDPSHDENQSWSLMTEDNDHVDIRAPELWRSDGTIADFHLMSMIQSHSFTPSMVLHGFWMLADVLFRGRWPGLRVCNLDLWDDVVMGKRRWSLNLLVGLAQNRTRCRACRWSAKRQISLHISSSSIAIPTENYRASAYNVFTTQKKRRGRWYVLSVCKSIEN